MTGRSFGEGGCICRCDPLLREFKWTAGLLLEEGKVQAGIPANLPDGTKGSGPLLEGQKPGWERPKRVEGTLCKGPGEKIGWKPSWRGQDLEEGKRDRT